MNKTPVRGSKAAKNGGAFERSFASYIKGHERYAISSQVRIPNGKPDGRLCILDTMLFDRVNAERIVISCKAQTSQGSVEEKMIYELFHLSHLVKSEVCERAYMVIIGSGFSDFRRFIMSRQFKDFCPTLAWGESWNGVEILGFDDMVTRIQREKL
jgi:hypothetical protein